MTRQKKFKSLKNKIDVVEANFKKCVVGKRISLSGRIQVYEAQVV